MSTLVTFLHIVVCLILVGTVLLQQGKGGSMGGAFGGANTQTVFGSGGASVFLRRLTAICATVFMLTSMVLAYIASNDAGDALKMTHCHLPDDKTAPVVTDEDRLVDVQVIEQPDQIARQVNEIVVLDIIRPIARAVATLIRRDDANAHLTQRLDLMPP